jgi:exodeoxyribonuclease VII small subunit
MQTPMTRSAPASPTPSFEQSLHELESIVDALERGDLTLEASLAAFERGVALTRTCRQALDAAEQRVRILTDQRADSVPEPFETSPPNP